MTRQHAGTPMWRVEHAVSSAARKFKKIMSSKKKPTNAPDAAVIATAITAAPTMLEDIQIEDKVTSTSPGEKDKDLSSAEMGGPTSKATVQEPQMKKIASASA